MNCFVYIIQGADTHFYTGVTNDVKKRIDQHNGVIKGGARYTRKQRPYVLTHLEKMPSRSAALKREYEIKQLTHVEKSLLRNVGT